MNSNFSYEHSEILTAPHQIAFDITNKCNLRCLHCYNFSGENIIVGNELTDGEIINFVESLEKLKLYNLCFCGGETLLRKNIIIESTKILTRNNITNVSMVSNGLLFNYKTAEELKAAGLHRIQFSLDGYTKESHDRLRNKIGTYEKVMESIKIATELDFILEIAFSPTSFNIEEFTDLCVMLKSINEKIIVRVQPLMLLGRASLNLEEINPTSIQYRRLVRQINILISKHYRIEWGDPVDHLMRFSSRSLPVNHSNVRANGDIAVSPYLPLIVGNIKKHTFQEYWDAGLNKVWERKIPRLLASRIKSINDMTYISNELPKLFKEDDINIDLIEEDLDDLNSLKDFSFIY
jgi:MoaA/NifB/PqqE/SkfB family radical SAM enzyme